MSNVRTYEIVSKWIADTCGVHLVIEPNASPRCDIKNKTIYLPSNIKNSNVLAAIATVMHEAGHIKYTTPIDKHIEEIARDKTDFEVCNAIEDVRINQKMFRVLPNAKKFFELLYEKTSVKQNFCNASLPEKVLCDVMMDAEDSRAFRPYKFNTKEINEIRKKTKVDRLFSQAVNIFEELSYSSSYVQSAKDIVHKIRDVLFKSQPQQQPKQGQGKQQQGGGNSNTSEGGSGNSNQSNNKQNNQGQNKKEDGNGGEDTNSGSSTDPKNSQDKEQGGGSGGKGSPDNSEKQEKGGNSDTDKGDGDGEGNNQNQDQGQGNQPTQQQDMNKQAEEQQSLGNDSNSIVGARCCGKGVFDIDHNAPKASKADLGEVAYNEITKAKFIEALNVKNTVITEDGNILNTDNLTSFFTEDLEELFMDEKVERKIKSKIYFLLDASGSMKTGLLCKALASDVLCKAVRGLTNLIEEVKLIEGLNLEYEIRSFHGRYIKLDKEKWFQQYDANGGSTHLLEAFRECMNELINDFDVDGKKMMLIFTDGQVSEYQIEDMKKDIMRYASDIRVMVVGIGSPLGGYMEEHIIGDNNILATEMANEVIFNAIETLLG